MEKSKLTNLPLTRLEQGLKRCYLQRPDISSRILSGDELTDYTGWMVKEFGSKVSLSAKKVIISDLNNNQGGPLMEIGRRILLGPSDSDAFMQLSNHLGKQSEASYIRSDEDMSVMRMARYMPAHWHQNQFFEMYYAFSGNCPIHFANEVVTIKPGSFLIVAPNVIHANPCYGDNNILVYYNIRSSTFDRVFWDHIPAGNLLSRFFRQALNGKEPNSYLQFDTGGDEEIRDLMERIYNEYQAPEAYASQLMNAYMSTCFILLLRRYEGTVRLPRTEDFFWKHEYSAILSYIQMHYDTVKLADLAGKFHYSEKQIRRIVETTMDMSYSDLIMKLRMQRASELLKLQDYTIEDIALQVGYTTVSSFYRSFTKYYDCTPAEYRNKHPELQINN